MKTTIIAMIAAGLLAGCASLQNAGTAEYSIRPFVADAATGTAICCEVIVKNGKEIANLEAHIEKRGDNYTVALKEQGIVAFKGQEIAASATQAAITAAAKAAATAALAPILPALLPAAGAVLSSGNAGAAAVGAGAVLLKDAATQ